MVSSKIVGINFNQTPIPRKNLLSLHEAIVVALVNQQNRTATFDEIADSITGRELYPERKGNTPVNSDYAKINKSKWSLLSFI